MALTILSLSFLGFLILGVPVAFAIGLSAVCTILYEGLPVAVVFQRMTSGMTVFSFLAIPFFIFAGELMLYGAMGVTLPELREALALVAAGRVRPMIDQTAPLEELPRLMQRMEERSTVGRVVVRPN